MISFKEFLQSQENRLIEEREARVQRQKKWINAVNALMDQVRHWILEADPHHLVKIDQQLVGDLHTDGSGFLRELDSLGRMCISIGNQTVNLTPVTRDLFGPRWKPGDGSWLGQITMFKEPYKYEVLLFAHDDGREEWYIRDDAQYVMKLLTRETFDAALVDLFA